MTEQHRRIKDTARELDAQDEQARAPKTTPTEAPFQYPPEALMGELPDERAERESSERLRRFVEQRRAAGKLPPKK